MLTRNSHTVSSHTYQRSTMKLALTGLACLVLWLCFPTQTYSQSQQNITSTLIKIVTGQHPISSLETDRYTWYCPDSHPRMVTWRNRSSSGDITTTEDFTGVDESKAVKVTFTNWSLHKHDFGIEYVCSSKWYPASGAPDECGGEGQKVCWGAQQSDGWRRADWMFGVSFSGACDRGLIIDGVSEDSSCKDERRHKRDDEGHGGTWATWALDNQRNHLQKREPLNWISTFGTHESFNARNDGYTFPNQHYSLSDQLDAGARIIDLRPRWGVGATDYLRLSHGTNSCGGCSGLDRPYMYAIQEIGKWLDDNPEQVIMLGLSHFDGDDHSYIDDPLEAYIGDKVLGPREWCRFLNPTDPGVCTLGGNYKPTRWPTIAEMQNPDNWSCGCRKQVIAFESQSNWDSAYTFSFDTTGDLGLSDRYARNFNATQCKLNEKAFLYDAASTDVSRTDYDLKFSDIYETRVFGQAVHDYDSWPGYIYAYQSDIPDSDGRNDLAAPRPYATKATSVEALLNCNVSMIDLDFFMKDQFFNGDADDVGGQTDRREAFVWTWAEDDYGSPNTAALLKNSDGRFHSENPANLHYVACAKETKAGSGMFRAGDSTGWDDPVGRQWRITAGVYSWENASQACQEETNGDTSWVFAAPVSKLQKNQLIAANTQAQDLWISYTNNTTSGNWVVTAPPSLKVENTSVDEGSQVTIVANGKSPSGEKLSYLWDFDNDGTYETVGKQVVFTAAFLDGPTSRTFNVKVVDANGLQRATQSTVTVNNVAPVVAAGVNKVINEGGTATLTPVSFHDVCSLDTHTATIDWGDGTPVTTGTVAEPSVSKPLLGGIDGTVSGSHVYGDNGNYTVKVCVKDDDGGRGCNTLTVSVNNLSPSLTLNTSTAIAFGNGSAFLGRLGVEQSHDASANDPGSDDLTFKWSFAPSTFTASHPHFNNGTSADPPKSGPGLFPFPASDTVKVTFTASGIYTVRIDLLDDDGGANSSSLPKLITGNATRSNGDGFWRQQFSGKGNQQIDNRTLQSYLDVVGFASRIFNEKVPAATLAQAQLVLQPGGASVGDTDPSNMKGKATQEAFMAWLNFASGGVGWNQSVWNGLTFHDAMAQVETILSTPNRTHADYVLAKNIAASVNGASASNLHCDFCPSKTDGLAMDGSHLWWMEKSQPASALRLAYEATVEDSRWELLRLLAS